MASTDAKPVPIKGQDYRVTFPVFASDGALSLGQTLLSQISIDAASAIYGARPVEITANMGLYYLDLTAAEMNGQTIAVVATPSGGGSGANVAVRSVPIILYTQGPTAGFYAQVMSVDATPLDGIASTVWASSSRSLSTFGNIVNAVWATPTRTLSALDDLTLSTSAAFKISQNVWATGSRTLSSLDDGVVTTSAVSKIAAGVWATPATGQARTDLVHHVWATPSRTLSTLDDSTLATSAVSKISANVWATSGRTLSSLDDGVVSTSTIRKISSGVWATAGRALTDWDGIVNAVWATPTRTLSSIDNVKASLVSTVWATPTRTLSAGVTVAAGGIDSTSFAASAVDAAAFAQDAAQEVADEMLNRNLAGSGSGGARIVRDALRVLRNKVDASAGIVYQEDDAATAWTFTTTSDALATRITGIDPA